MAADPRRVKELFVAALDLPDPQARQGFLDRECGPDADLRQRLEVLLKAHDDPASALNQPLAAVGLVDAGATVDDAPAEGAATASYHGSAEQPGALIAGRYKLLEQIGEGGMGTVWVAEQTQPVRRKVALKLIKAGMDSQTVLSRFEAERQALALMDHPNIAKVLDGGTTESGRPFFVMEYVKGVAFTQYCDDARLSIAERLALFVPVCQAVQHAHQKGIIHRDLKPSNILICLYDGQPVPKVIDFGLAKAMHQPLTEHTLHTAHGAMMGTPLYMSPEQAEFNNLDVDTRTDVYALGVILYELLTGTTPLERQRFKEAAWQEMLRLIKDEEPPRPSTRLSGSATLPSLAAQRRLEPVKLTKLVRGELDWIVMKALEKDRARRYETATGLARDIERYLHDEAVEACPPSATYRLRKFARRYRAALATAAAFALLLLVGAAVSAWQAVRATQAEQAALLASEQESRQRQQAEEQRNRAVEAETAARANEQKARDEEKKARESILEMMVLLEVFQNHVWDVTAAYKDGGKLEQAIGFYDQASAALKAKLGPEHNSTYVSAMNLAVAYQAAGKLDQAIALFEQSLPVLKAGPGPNHPTTLLMMSRLAEAYNDARKWAQAIPLFEHTLAAQKVTLGADNDYTLTTMNNLGVAYWGAGKLHRAIPLFEQTLEARQTKFGRNHAHAVTSLKNLAGAYQNAGKRDQAVLLFGQALEARQTMLGPDHPSTLVSSADLARAYRAQGQLDRATPLFEQTLAAWKAKRGPDAPDTLISMHDLALAYRDAGRLPEALPLLESAVSGFKKHYGLADQEARAFQRDLADLYERLQQADRAEPLRRELIPVTKEKAGTDSPVYSSELHLLGVNLMKQRKHSEAEPVWRECLAIRAKTLPDDWKTFNTQALLGATLLRQKKYADAEPLLLSGYEGMKDRQAKIPAASKVRLTEILQRLVELYDASGQQDKADEWRRKLAAAKAVVKEAPKK